MKKIGLVTYYNSENYGAMLQAYALKETINKNKCECVLVAHDRFNLDIKKSSTLKTNKLQKVKRVARNVLANPNSINLKIAALDQSIKHQLKRVAFKNEKFRDEFFKEKTDEFYLTEEQILENPPQLDAFVCGSDQIWNPERFVGSGPYYLNFVNNEAEKIAYAPSFAGGTVPKEFEDKYRELLSSFTSLSAREINGCNEIRKIIGKDVFHALDPVFLLSKKEWQEFAKKPVNKNEKYIFCYFISRENLLSCQKAIKKIAKNLNLSVIVLPYGLQVADKTWKSVEDVGPQEFVSLIDNASYVITDSFHGTAFSIILEKQFSIYHGSSLKQTNTRFERISDLFTRLNIKDVEFTSHENIKLSNIDYIKVNQLLKLLIKDSKSYLSNALSKVKEKKLAKVSEVKLASNAMCTGCSACKAVCPTSSITMQKDDEGFWRPVINTATCVKCKKCESVCPVLVKNNYLKKEQNYYASYCKTKNFRSEGSSGNVFGMLSRTLSKQNAVIYGAALSKDCRSLNTCSTLQTDFKSLQRSKYIESNMNETFANIKKDLDSGKTVLFTGTPCQIQAAREVFKDAKNLYLCDFICHGVPSIKAYNSYLDILEKKKSSKVKEVIFRSKKIGWHLHCMYVTFENGTEYLKNEYEDLWFQSFQKNKNLRLSCYSCKKVNNSAADITIGDYWEVKERENIDDDDTGISIVRINTEKGKLLFDQMTVENEDIFAVELKKEDVEETFSTRIKKYPKVRDFSENGLLLNKKQQLKGKIHTVYDHIIKGKRRQK